MNVVGIDPSYTATGIAFADGRVAKHRWSGKERCRLADAYDALSMGTLWPVAPDLVVIESYSHGSKHAAHKMGELGGVMRLALMHAGIPYVDAAPTAVKKYATGKGNATKEAVLAAAIRRLDYEGASTDEADALWLRQLGLAHIGDSRAVEVPAVHREALKALEAT